MRMRALVCVLACAAAGALLAAPASAAIIDSGNELIDSDSGLIWLDLTETVGKSINTALDDNPGYLLGTTDQVSTLFTNAGFTTLNNSATVANGPAALALIDGLGCTTTPALCAGLNAFARGLADNSGGGGYYSPLYRIAPPAAPNNTGAAAVISLFVSDPDASFGDRGVYLYRLVPEPGTALLFGLGLVGLALRGRR